MERTLLLVDDEENILRALTRVLRRDGYQILRANGGSEGLTLLAEHPEVGVILSDQRMPGMTGIDFLSQVREHHPGTVRMILSGYTDLKTVTDAINEGAVYKFLTKPWEDELLRANVEEAFHYGELARENKRLTRELKTSNEQLERRVEEKTRQVLLNQKMLAISQEVLEHLPAGVLGIDDDGIIVFVNRQAHTLLGRDAQNLVGQTASTLLPLAICALLQHASSPTDAHNIPLNKTLVDVHCGRMGQDSPSQGSIVVLTKRHDDNIVKDKQHIGLEQAEPDMTLAQDLLDIEGHCLMTTGTLLTKDKLASLQRRGIRNLVVWGAETLDPQEIEMRRTAAQTQLDRRFRQVEQEPTMRALKATLLDYRLKNLK